MTNYLSETLFTEVWRYWPASYAKYCDRLSMYGKIVLRRRR